MSYLTNHYYSKASSGKVIQWSGEVTDDGTIIIRTGQLDGVLRSIRNDNIEGKNIGKSNATTKFTQAVKEVKAKVKKKQKEGYKTLESLGDDIATLDLEGHRLLEVLDTRLAINKTDANNVLKPMKAKQFKEVTKFKFPYLLQLKINGYRTVYDLFIGKVGEGMFSTNIVEPRLLSKNGFEFPIQHIKQSLTTDFFNRNDVRLDGELYVHGEKLSVIKKRVPITLPTGTVTKNSLSSDPLKLYCFDLSIPDVLQTERLQLKNELLKDCSQLNIYTNPNNNKKEIVYYKSPTNDIIVNMGYIIVHNLQDVQEWLTLAIQHNYEGIILRQLDIDYQFGSRKFNMIKAKLFISSEFKILDIIKKNEDSTRTYVSFILQNDMNDRTFTVQPNGNEKQRQEYLNNKDYYIGKIVTVDFYERTVYDIPFHILNVTVREEFDLDIDDLIPEI